MRKAIFILVILLLGSQWVLAQENWYEKVKDLSGTWKFTIGDRSEWANPDYPDGSWADLNVPGSWEDQGFHGFDGYAWYRLRFNGKELIEEHDYYLSLGYIDDVDEVYFNGKLIGFSGSFPPNYQTAYFANRQYVVPKDLINFSGYNTIAVRVYDETHKGGIISGRVGLYKLKKELSVKKSLEGVWRFKEGSRSQWIEPDFDDAAWSKVMLPHKWKTHGTYKNSVAVYRTTFELSAEEAKMRYMVVLGRIDDFDQTYINGQFIGETNDHRNLGSSQSWNQLRVYSVPDGILKAGQNQLTVVVDDIGLDAGMYKGPYFLIPEQYATRYLRDNFN